MSLRTRFFALTYDRQIAKTEQAGLHGWRAGLLAGASGDVLEIGGGTGANLPCYGPAVGALTLTEPQPPMPPHLERHLAARLPLAPQANATRRRPPPFVRPAILGSATAPLAAPRAHQDCAPAS